MGAGALGAAGLWLVWRVGGDTECVGRRDIDVMHTAAPTDRTTSLCSLFPKFGYILNFPS